MLCCGFPDKTGWLVLPNPTAGWSEGLMMVFTVEYKGICVSFVVI